MRKPYKEIKFSGEFAPELKFVVPFAYWHYLNGTLKSTSSSIDTKSFYFFSNDHKEVSGNRIWNEFNFDTEIPNSEDHNKKYDFSKWAKVPFKDEYKNNEIQFEKPILVISNKYNQEWGEKPINFIDKLTLESLFISLKNSFQIIYNRPTSNQIIDDNSQIHNLNEQSLLNRFREVLSIQELWKSQGKDYSFNTFQLMVYANCEKFISVQGGNSVLASYFGGMNIILIKKGHELYFDELATIYPKLSGCKVLLAKNENELLSTVYSEYLD